MPLPIIPPTLEWLTAGMRFCVGCASCCIYPHEPSYVVRCPDCWREKKTARYCRCCGSVIDRLRVNVANDHGNEAWDCWHCKNGKEIGRKTLMESLSAAAP